MKAHTMDQQFLSELHPEQKGVIWEYFRLITKSGYLQEPEVARISTIWKLAEQDEQLFRWLEFIDYLFTNVEENELPNEERRAYISEYLEVEVGIEQIDKAFIFRVLQCPHDGGKVVILWDEKTQGQINSPCFYEHICSTCGHKYAEHFLVDGVTTTPNP
jgi:hypothetical protein